jgi:hypothetical protein
MITKAATDAVKEVAPPAIISAATMLGIGLQDWVLYLTLAYAAIRILALLPKLFGCGRCFVKNRACLLTCRQPPLSE